MTTTDSSARSWHVAYAQLKQFISVRSDIAISHGGVTISSDAKEEFYRLFDATRIAFIEEHCHSVMNRGLELSRHYKALRAGLLREAGFDSVETSTDLAWFLEEPYDGVMRFLFDPLFKLLKNQMELEEFERIASRKANDAFTALFREGYQRWVALGIIRRFSPDKSYRVPAKDAIHDVMIGEGHERPGQFTSDVPMVQEISGISFELHPVISFIVPRITTRSRRTGTFMAMHTDFREAEWTARQRSSNMEWHEIAAIKAEHKLSKIRPDLYKKDWYELDPVLPDLALYAATNVDDLSLVADYKYMLRPEICIAVMESPNWHEAVNPEDIKRRLLSLHPRQGAFIICQQEIPTSAITTFGGNDDIKLLHIGYNEDALETISGLLLPLS